MENPPQTAPAEQAVQREYTDEELFSNIKTADPISSEEMCDLGDKHYYGIGVEQNYAEAVKWYRKAAEQGNAKAQYNLGSCYYNGKALSKIIQKP